MEPVFYFVKCKNRLDPCDNGDYYLFTLILRRSHCVANFRLAPAIQQIGQTTVTKSYQTTVIGYKKGKRNEPRRPQDRGVFFQ